MKTFTVTTADVITPKGTEPFVGLTVKINGKDEQIARTCKQALLDLHKSARGANIPGSLFDNGVTSANPLMMNQFRNAVIGLVNKTGFADVEFHEAGDDYVATAESTAVRNGTAQIGETLKTLKKGSRVEGFIAFPLTSEETMMEQLVANNASAILDRIFGVAPVVMSAPTPAPIAIGNPIADKIEEEVFGPEQTEGVVFETPEEEVEETPEAEEANVKAKAGKTGK